jgi:DNA-binding winged helix-turn-helix (wHTH) protein
VICRFGPFELDESLWELRRNGQPVAIQRKALETVLFLVRHRERVVSRDELRAGMWPGTAVSETAIAHAIMQARRALDDAHRCWIQTVRGRGVRFVGTVEEDPREGPLPRERLNEREDAASHSAWRAVEGAAPQDTSEFERQVLRCLHVLSGAVAEIARSASTGTSIADALDVSCTSDIALWDLAQRFRLAQNVTAARHTLEFLVERYPRSRLAPEARIALVRESPPFGDGSARECRPAQSAFRKASGPLTEARPVSISPKHGG